MGLQTLEITEPNFNPPWSPSPLFSHFRPCKSVLDRVGPVFKHFSRRTTSDPKGMVLIVILQCTGKKGTSALNVPALAWLVGAPVHSNFVLKSQRENRAMYFRKGSTSSSELYSSCFSPFFLADSSEMTRPNVASNVFLLQTLRTGTYRGSARSAVSLPPHVVQQLALITAIFGKVQNLPLLQVGPTIEAIKFTFVVVFCYLSSF